MDDATKTTLDRARQVGLKNGGISGGRGCQEGEVRRTGPLERVYETIFGPCADTSSCEVTDVQGFGDPNYLSGVYDPSTIPKEEKETQAAESRTTMGMVGDVATKVIDPVIGLVRAGTTAAREVFPKSEWANEADEDVARWQKNLQENLTPYQKAVDASRWFPGYGERRAMDRLFSRSQ